MALIAATTVAFAHTHGELTWAWPVLRQRVRPQSIPMKIPHKDYMIVPSAREDTVGRWMPVVNVRSQWGRDYGTSLSDILEGSGAPRGSLYFHFPGGKDQLVLEATRAAVAEATHALEQTLTAADDRAEAVRPPPRGRLRRSDARDRLRLRLPGGPRHPRCDR